MRHHLYVMFLLGLVSACSGGAGGGQTPSDGREPIVPIIPNVDIAPTGTASYYGQVALGFRAPSTAQAIALDGDLTLQVNFDQRNSAVAGFAEGFQHNNSPYVGTLFLSAGTLDDNSGRLDFAAQLSGALKQDTDTYLIFGQMTGEFLGASEQAVSGQVLGTARQAGRDSAMSGQFQVARQP